MLDGFAHGPLIAVHYAEDGRDCTRFIQAMIKDSSPP